MLRIRIRLPGRCFSSSIDACRPFISGIDMSITTTSGSSFLHERDRLETVSGFADDFDVRVVFQDASEPLPHQRVVVDQHDRIVWGLRCSTNACLLVFLWQSPMRAPPCRAAPGRSR